MKLRPKEIYDISIDFAKRVSELKPTSFEQALIEYTPIPSALFVPAPEFPKKDPTQPLWLEYLAYIQNKEIKDATYKFIGIQAEIREKNRPTKPKDETPKPCFFFYPTDDSAQVHFNNNEGPEPGPLSKERVSARLVELKEDVNKLHTEHPEVKTICGYSWLYNINAYKRLFPIEFTQTAKIDYSDFAWNVYGQFLNSNKELKVDMIKDFKEKMDASKTFDELMNSIEFPPLRVSAPIGVFLNFYKNI